MCIKERILQVEFDFTYTLRHLTGGFEACPTWINGMCMYVDVDGQSHLCQQMADSGNFKVNEQGKGHCIKACVELSSF